MKGQRVRTRPHAPPGAGEILSPPVMKTDEHRQVFAFDILPEIRFYVGTMRVEEALAYLDQVRAALVAIEDPDALPHVDVSRRRR